MPPAPVTPNKGLAPNIFAQIRKEQYDFMYNWISIVPGYPFNQYQTIKRIHLYLNSKFEDATTYLGREKIFFNIVVPPCEVAMRMLNLDTKNIKLWPMNPKSYFSTYLLEKELKQWLKNHKLGKVLNQLAEEAPRYGSVVLEKTVDGANVVDLRRLILDPTVETITKSRFVTTINYMTPSELRKTGWKDVDLAIERFENYNTEEPYEDQYVNVNVMRSTPYIKVFKRYGEVPGWWLDSTLKAGTKAGDELVRSLFIIAGADWVSKNPDGQPIGDLGVILFKSKWVKDWPFKDFHYSKTRGRWLGIGVVESLFQVQERVNEMKNQKRIAMEISSLHLFQSKDKSIVRNVLTDLQNGDLILTGRDGGIEPIANEERNMAAFEDEEKSYSEQANNLTFAYEAVRGDDTNSTSATLGQTQIAVAQGTSVFAFKKENFANFIHEYFEDLVLDQLMKDLTPEHIMRFVGSTQEVQKLDDAAAEVYANDYVKDEMLNGKMVVGDDYDGAKAKAKAHYQKMGSNRFLKIKDAFYDDAEFEFDFLITNEQEDPAAMAQNIQQVLTDIPALMQFRDDPMIKLLISKLFDNIGISQGEFELADQQATQMKQQGQLPDPMQQNQPQPSPFQSKLLAQPQSAAGVAK